MPSPRRGGACLIPMEHHHVPRYQHCSRRRWHSRPGRPARSGCFSPGDEPSGFRCRIRRRTAGLAQPRQPSRLHQPGPAASPARAGQSQAQAVRRAGRGGACRHRAAGRPRRTRRDRQWRNGLRQDHRWHCHGGRAARRRLPPHAGPLTASPGLQVAPGNPGNRGRREGLGAQRPRHAGQAHQAARAVGRAGARPGVLRARARADAHGFPLEARLQRAAHEARRSRRMPGLRPGHHQPRRRANQPGRTRS
mmetsp:Transcript_20239/g.37518  ORF Transcript_20239/g.37518 Transcript_20239/m.37518 type:complete len:250 (-) Transcript_20239:1178-1927(-)